LTQANKRKPSTLQAFAFRDEMSLAAFGLQKEELVQALGRSFTVSTIALAVNGGLEAGLQLFLTKDMLVAVALACAGIWIGQALRLRVPPMTFRRWFFAGLLMLGGYLGH
jgi:uncharacterized membrane protein YfcA